MWHLHIFVVLVGVTLFTACANDPIRIEMKNNAMPTVTPFLMFQDGRAEEAMNFYVATFPDGQVNELSDTGLMALGQKARLS